MTLKRWQLAIRTARSRSKAARPTSEVGMCLRECRECYGIAPGARTAAEAWYQSGSKHHLGSYENPKFFPRGAAIFWTGGSSGAGHIAIANGYGKCWSTDIRRPGFFDLVPIDEIRAKWGLTLVGYTLDLNGTTLGL